MRRPFAAPPTHNCTPCGCSKWPADGFLAGAAKIDVTPKGAYLKEGRTPYFVGEDSKPIGVLMNYGMHPIEYFITGALSADFPVDASRYFERRYPGAISLFVLKPDCAEGKIIEGALKLIDISRTDIVR